MPKNIKTPESPKKKLGRPATAPADQMRFTVYLSGALVWEARKLGLERKLYGDNDIIRAALAEWVRSQKKG